MLSTLTLLLGALAAPSLVGAAVAEMAESTLAEVGGGGGGWRGGGDDNQTDTLGHLREVHLGGVHLGGVHLGGGGVHLGGVHLGGVHHGGVHLGGAHLGRSPPWRGRGRNQTDTLGGVHLGGGFGFHAIPLDFTHANVKVDVLGQLPKWLKGEFFKQAGGRFAASEQHYENRQEFEDLAFFDGLAHVVSWKFDGSGDALFSNNFPKTEIFETVSENPASTVFAQTLKWGGPVGSEHVGNNPNVHFLRVAGRIAAAVLEAGGNDLDRLVPLDSNLETNESWRESLNMSGSGLLKRPLVFLAAHNLEEQVLDLANGGSCRSDNASSALHVAWYLPLPESGSNAGYRVYRLVFDCGDEEEQTLKTRSEILWDSHENVSPDVIQAHQLPDVTQNRWPSIFHSSVETENYFVLLGSSARLDMTTDVSSRAVGFFNKCTFQNDTPMEFVILKKIKNEETQEVCLLEFSHTVKAEAAGHIWHTVGAWEEEDGKQGKKIVLVADHTESWWWRPDGTRVEGSGGLPSKVARWELPIGSAGEEILKPLQAKMTELNSTGVLGFGVANPAFVSQPITTFWAPNNREPRAGVEGPDQALFRFDVAGKLAPPVMWKLKFDESDDAWMVSEPQFVPRPTTTEMDVDLPVGVLGFLAKAMPSCLPISSCLPRASRRVSRETDGVLFVQANNITKERSWLLAIDPQTMVEVARASVPEGFQVNQGLHSLFVPAGKMYYGAGERQEVYPRLKF